MEVLAAVAAVAGGVATGAAITRTTWPALGRVAAVLALTAAVFFIGGQIGAAVTMDRAGEALAAQMGSAFLAVLSGMTWGLVGALLWLAGMLFGWVLAIRRTRAE